MPTLQDDKRIVWMGGVVSRGGSPDLMDCRLSGASAVDDGIRLFLNKDQDNSRIGISDAGFRARVLALLLQHVGKQLRQIVVLASP